MYKNVLLTDKEIALLKRVVGDYLHEKIVPEATNLTIILNRLREIKPQKDTIRVSIRAANPQIKNK